MASYPAYQTEEWLACASNPESTTLANDLANLTVTPRPSSSPDILQGDQEKREDIRGKEEKISIIEQYIKQENNITVYDADTVTTSSSSESSTHDNNIVRAPFDPTLIPENANLQQDQNILQLDTEVVPSWDACLHPYKEDNLFLDPELDRPAWTMADETRSQMRVKAWLDGMADEHIGTEEMDWQNTMTWGIWDVDNELSLERDWEERNEDARRRCEMARDPQGCAEKIVRERILLEKEYEIEGNWDEAKIKREIRAEIVKFRQSGCGWFQEISLR